MQNEFVGKEENYTRKKGLVHTDIVLPANSPEWARDPGQLWNQVEKKENRKNSTIAREFLISLPHELSNEKRKELSQDISRNLVERFGFAVQYSIHLPDKKDGLNHHVHILASTRKLESSGFSDKTRELDEVAKAKDANGKSYNPAVVEVREMVASTINKHLHAAGFNIVLSHKSLADQKAEAAEKGDVNKFVEVNREPTVKIGHNPAARQARVEQNRSIQTKNAETKSTFAGLLKAAINPIERPTPTTAKKPSSTFNLKPSKDAAQGNAPPAIAGSADTAEADGSIAEIESQIGEVEAAIALLKLKPGKASDLQLKKKIALKEKLSVQLKIAIAKKVAKKYGVKMIQGGAPTFIGAPQQDSQQPQQPPPPTAAEVEKELKTKQEADELRRQARLFEKKAMDASPTEKMKLWSKAFELDQQAATIELQAKAPKQSKQSKPTTSFRPRGM